MPTSPKINTFREITPLIYSWKTPDIPKYDGWEKIGYTEQESADTRIAQQASQLSVDKQKLWSRRALFTSEAGGRFTDSDFHAYLKQQGVERETQPKRTEWHHFAPAPKSSLEYFNDFAGQDFPDPPGGGGEDDYTLRPEQQAAVDQAVAAFTGGKDEVLWNAKPRFGKTLTTYDLMRTLDVRKVLIVTNRPAIANSWFDDFTRFIGHQTTYRFVSDSPSLANRSPMTREQWRAYSNNHLDEDPRIVEFLSLQDLKGSQYFGGSYDKLRHIAQFDWDLLVIDEAHNVALRGGGRSQRAKIAEVLARRSLDRKRAIGDHQGIAVTLGTLGRIALLLVRYEFRGTMEIPFQVLMTRRAGSLQEARELCHAYACQIVLHDDTGVRGWVKPDGRYELSGRDPSVAGH